MVGAEAGTLAIMAGGDAAIVENLADVFSALGRVTHVGPRGAGQICKLANQQIVAITIGAVAEAMILVEAGGASREKFHEAIRGGFAESRILDLHGGRMVARSSPPAALPAAVERPWTPWPPWLSCSRLDLPPPPRYATSSANSSQTAGARKTIVGCCCISKRSIIANGGKPMSEANKTGRRLRSQNWFDNPDHIDLTALYLERFMNYGTTPEELRSGKPIIGIAQSGSTSIPATATTSTLPRLRDGIRDAGGIPIEFPTHLLFGKLQAPDRGTRPQPCLSRPSSKSSTATCSTAWC